MLECIEKIFIYAGNYEKAEELAWENDQRDYNAIWALLLVIGEESKKLNSNLKNEFKTIPWQNVAGMRNYMAHDYRGIDHDRVWEVVKSSLPELKDALISMIDRVAYEEQMLVKALNSPYYRHIQYLREN